MTKQTLGASLGARFAVTSKENIEARKKTNPRRSTLSAATTKELHNAVNMLAIKLKTTRSGAIERAVAELCDKHGIDYGTLE